jgi:hypothetical protein
MSAILATPSISKVRWTIEQYRTLNGSGILGADRTKLLDGEIYTIPFPDRLHNICMMLLAKWWGLVFDVGFHVRNQMGFAVGQHNIVGPDFAVMVGDVRNSLEVADASLTLDITVKAELYATAGVPDYWVVDLEHRRILVFRDPVPLRPVSKQPRIARITPSTTTR